ncbi:Glucose-6-phosphatase [Homalodisca vitripennis]|nr:Glucose-6-phosphatase [Homalodisca vitripennis]
MIGYVLTDQGPWCLRNWWRGASRFSLFCVSLTLIAISAGAYVLQLALGVDPQWSVRMAFKWCRNPEYVHVVTTPLFSLVRDCGASLGLAMASPIKLSIPLGNKLKKSSKPKPEISPSLPSLQQTNSFRRYLTL